MADTTTTASKVTVTPLDTMAAEIDAIGLKVTTGFTLADAMRLGDPYTRQAFTWGAGDNACALSSARLAAQAVGYLPR